MRTPEKPKNNPLSQLVTILPLLAALGCQLPPEVENKIEFANAVLAGKDVNEFDKERRIEDAIKLLENVLDGFARGELTKERARDLTIAQVEEIGTILQEGVDNQGQATLMRIIDSGTNRVMETDGLRERIIALMADRCEEE